MRSGPGQWLGEVVATAGLIAVIFALAALGAGLVALLYPDLTPAAETNDHLRDTARPARIQP